MAGASPTEQHRRLRLPSFHLTRERGVSQDVRFRAFSVVTPEEIGTILSIGPDGPRTPTDHTIATINLYEMGLEGSISFLREPIGEGHLFINSSAGIISGHDGYNESDFPLKETESVLGTGFVLFVQPKRKTRFSKGREVISWASISWEGVSINTRMWRSRQGWPKDVTLTILTAAGNATERLILAGGNPSQ